MKNLLLSFLLLLSTAAHASFSLSYQSAENVRLVLAGTSVGTNHYVPVINTLSTAVKGLTVANTSPSPLGVGMLLLENLKTLKRASL